MVRSLLIAFLTLIAATSAFSQNLLQLTHPHTGEKHLLKEGAFVVFRLKEDNTIREGYIREIRDTSLSFEDLLFEEQISLNDITILGATNRSNANAGRVTHAVGNALILAGLTAFDCGIGFMVHSDYYYWPVGGTIWLAGALVAGIGHAIDWSARPMGPSIKVKNYREWRAEIVRITPEPPVVVTPEPEKQAGTTDTLKNQEKKPRKSKPVSGDDVYGE